MKETEQLKEDLYILKEDLLKYGHEILENTTVLSSDIKEQYSIKILETTQKIQDISKELSYNTKIIIKDIDTSIKNKPYHTSGISILIGIGIGYILGKKK